MSWGDVSLLCLACYLLGRLYAGRVPEFVLSAHQNLFRAYWRWRCRYRGGRPRTSRELIDLIRRISRENPLWGAPRIHGELLKLGFQLAQSTVSRYMIPRKGRPTQSWKTFLRNHRDAIAAIDMFTVSTWNFTQLYAFVVLGHGRRKLLHIEVTTNPTALWLAGQITEAFLWDTAPGFIVRDNDGAYGPVFRRRLWVMGIRDRPTMPHSPWQNGHVERAIGSIRRECTDHIIVLNAAHLRRVLKNYADYYNNDRTHLAIGKDTPISRAVETNGGVVAMPVLGGLHHRYRRTATK